MANKSQENGTTILLGLKGYEVGMVAEREGKIVDVKIKERNPVCPSCSSVKLYRHGSGRMRVGATQLEQWQKGLP